jgi:L-histidine Nalpha-methyltransferase
MRDGDRFAFYDLAPGEESFRDAVLAGLGRPSKALPCKFFYDARGSALFEEICRLPEYYLTRTETAILADQAPEIAARMGSRCRIVEFGSGASRKARILLQTLEAPAAYVAVDISREHLRAAAADIATDFPQLPVIAVCADYTRPFVLPALPDGSPKRVGFFPGSTIGNFEPAAAEGFLVTCGEILGPGGEMLVGVDLKKEARILDAAYDDSAGVTAQFNLNLLERINRELGGALDLGHFEHHAFYNARLGRVEIYIRCLVEHDATVAGAPVHFARGELIHTEYSYKYDIAEFRDIAGRAGFRALDVWTDPERRFSVHYLKLR